MEKVKQINMSWVVVTNLKKAIKFFTEEVGLELKEFNEEFGWAELSGHEGGSRLGVAQASDREPIPAGHNSVVTFTVEDIEKGVQDLKKKGVTLIGDILEIPTVVKMQLFSDADGNKFQLVQTFENNNF